MPTASSASRPSVSAAAACEAVKPSELRDSTMSAPGWTPARSSRAATGTPSHCALPASVPPTSFETQVSVIVRSHERHGEQVTEGQLELVIDHPVQPQPPARGVELWRGQSRVDAVEVPGGRHEGRHTVDGHGSGGGVQHVRVRGGGQSHVGRALAVTGEHRHCAARRTDECGGPGSAGHREEHLAAARRSVARLRVHAARSSTCAGPGGPAVPEQRGEPGGHAGQGRDERERSSAGPGGGRRGGHEAEREHEQRRYPGPAPDREARGGRQCRDDQAHGQQEDQLVAGAEPGDREVLEPAGGEVDDGAADREERARGRIEDLRDQIGHRQGEGAGHHAGERVDEATATAVGSAGRCVGGLLLHGVRPRRRHGPGSAPRRLRIGSERVTCGTAAVRSPAPRRCPTRSRRQG